MQGFTKEQKERFNESAERFREGMKDHPENLRGRVIAINFKKKKIIKSKCRKGRKVA